MNQKFSNIRTIIFDLDGTLLDTLTDLANSVNEALAMHGLPQHTLSEVRQFVGNGIAKLAERAVMNGKSNPLYEAVLADTKALYAQKCRENTAPYAGILPLLHDLKEKGYTLAVVSNKPDAQVKKLCEDFFPGLIAESVGQQDGVLLKPAPDSLLRVMSHLHSSPKKTVYVGDSDVDIQTAVNAGVSCISVLWGFRDYDVLKAAGGNCFVHIPSEMSTLF